jgi:hypothetical protein
MNTNLERSSSSACLARVFSGRPAISPAALKGEAKADAAAAGHEPGLARCFRPARS